MEDDKEKLIEQFGAVSRANAERSRFYLESSAWNIETALSSFYEEGDSEEIASPEEVSVENNPRGEDMPKIGMNDSGDSSSEEEGQAFYAGGSEHSGQQVLGPSKKKKDVVSMLFKSAKEHGAEVMDTKEVKTKGKKLTFSGTGYRLGETDNDHEVIPGEPEQQRPRDVVLRMWKNGFSIDEGSLREYSDPANHEFLNSVRRGQIPLELVRNARGGEVYLNMEDHRNEDFAPKKGKVSAFSGSGHTLGRIGMNDSGDSSSEEEGQAFYAGGSEHSGQQVLGPSKKKKDVVSMLFKSAKEHGAEVMDTKEVKTKGKKLTFSGTGYRLGETDNDHEVIPGEPEQQRPRDVVLRMWKNGFSIDEGSLREYSDPANHEFLNSVRRGQIPLELVRNARGGEVYLNMEDHRNEDFAPKKGKVSAFSGSGHTLGSPAPSVIGQVTNPGTQGGASGSTVFSSCIGDSSEEEAKTNLKMDDSLPTTNVQLRLPDGSRLVLKLNHTHTVGDIRQYVSTARPNLSPDFAIMTTFPHEELKNDSLSLAEAKLLNAALVIK